jgi:hypothetical protein
MRRERTYRLARKTVIVFVLAGCGFDDGMGPRRGPLGSFRLVFVGREAMPATVTDGPTQYRIHYSAGSLTTAPDSGYALTFDAKFVDYPNIVITRLQTGAYHWSSDTRAFVLEATSGETRFVGAGDADTVRLYGAANGVRAPGAVYDFTFARK